MLNKNVLYRLNRYEQSFNDENLRNYLALLCSDYGIVDFVTPEKKDKYYEVKLISEYDGSHSTFYFNHDRFRFVNVLHDQIITEIEFDLCLDVKEKKYDFNGVYCTYSEINRKYSYLHTTDQSKTLTSLDFKNYTFDSEFENVFDFKEQFDLGLNYYKDEKSSHRGDYRLELYDDNKGTAMYLDKYCETYIYKPITSNNLESELLDIILEDTRHNQMHREMK